MLIHLIPTYLAFSELRALACSTLLRVVSLSNHGVAGDILFVAAGRAAHVLNDLNDWNVLN